MPIKVRTKMKERFLKLALVTCFVFMVTALFTVNASADTSVISHEDNVYYGIVASGYEGNVEWSIDTSGTLTLTGYGNLGNNFLNYEFPWINYASYVEKIIVGEGITYIGCNAFSSCSKIVMAVSFHLFSFSV